MSDNGIRCCDLVMKGGVTSGVVYPGAIREIAKRFHLVGIGGTSAGAIAATVAAAAEYRRRHTNSMVGYEMLDEVSEEMSRPGRLLSLFRPDRTTEHLFHLSLPFIDGRVDRWTTVKLLWKLRNKRRRHEFFSPLVANFFGACSGMAVDNESDEPALTMWLCDLLDRVAGKRGVHLTFRDLHDAPLPPGIDRDFLSNRRSIDFRAVTTSLTFHRPFEFPLEDDLFAFDPEEWRRLFPESVIEQLIDSAKAIESTKHKRDGKLPLPGLDLPIVVAARMSLSFPLLFSAVPLWTANLHKDGNPLERVWFSDGGITSNFPVHRFDSIYPRWPTLALNFKGTDADGKPQHAELRRTGKFVYMNANRDEGVLDIWATFAHGENSVKSLFGFLFSIFRSAQNWHDNAFLRLPGFQDRVAEIWLKPGEGGLNLDMKPESVRRLVALGEQAGKRLAERYSELDPTDQMSWTGHQWTRFRSGMEGLTHAVERFGASLGDSGIDGTVLGGLLSSQDAPPCYPFASDSQRQAARDLTTKIHQFSQELERLKAFDGGPRPSTEYGSRAPISQLAHAIRADSESTERGFET